MPCQEWLRTPAAICKVLAAAGDYTFILDWMPATVTGHSPAMCFRLRGCSAQNTLKDKQQGGCT